ncbi:MAG: methylated-DNA--[protein]-cysteine S-methyltransferase [Solirubrobacterales bacterium]|nr:methylated-DNA--[protein]-cysteine S-methyltransferase [Solirubrobacterales bacterium]
MATLQLKQYFAGDRERFDILLDLSAGSPFERRVWEAIKRVPYGTTLTDAELAIIVGRPAALRAVATAVDRTPVPILIPRHRVIATERELTDGAGGTDRQEALLDLERRAISGHPPDRLTYRDVELARARAPGEPCSRAPVNAPLAAPRRHVLERSRS